MVAKPDLRPSLDSAILMIVMAGEIPASFGEERQAVEAEIKEAFGAVQRNGVSWSESRAIDGYGSMEERQAARLRGRDTHWMQLVDDPNWNCDPPEGGWCFLDADGFRYYLPAGMIRCLKSGFDEGIQFHLLLPSEQDELREYRSAMWSLLNQQQRLCIRRFLMYMASLCPENPEKLGWGHMDWSWKEALDAYWGGVDGQGSQT